MALFDRVSAWFDRLFDMSEADDDALDVLPADEGLLMAAPLATVGPAAPPVLPQLDAGAAPARVETVAPLPPVGEPVSARPAVKVVSLADLKDDDDEEDAPEADADETETAELETEAEHAIDDAALAGTPEATGETEEAPGGEGPPEEPAPLAVVSGDSAEKPAEGAMVSASSSPDALLGAFRKAGEVSEVDRFTRDMEDVPAMELLRDAREVLSILAPGDPTEDAA